jgi:FkbM family methyltransferase
MRTVNIHGFRFSVEPEPQDYWEWIEQGHYRADFSTIDRFASREINCIDAGAWIGAYTLYSSQKFKHVYAVEPDPVALGILKSNLGANHLDNFTIYDGALMGHSGTVSIGGSALGCSCTRESCKENAVTVPCVTLREFAKDIPDPLFIKMDVEGAEAKILKDWEFFSERKPDLMLSTHLDWWKEGGSDGREEYATISKVGMLYQYAFHSEGRSHVNLNSQYGDVIFTNKR